MSERSYACTFVDGTGAKRTFRCVESQLQKENWVCPKTGANIDPVTLRPVVV